MKLMRPRIILSYIKYYLTPKTLKLNKILGCGIPKINNQTIPNTFNFKNTTQLCQIMYASGSDKGKGSHNYTTFYSAIYARNKKLKIERVFELGLGSNNINTPSNMGINGVPGASLRGWKKFFTNAYIFGADIDKGSLFHEPGISTYYCDQLSSKSIKHLWNKNMELSKGFDFIIEDGLHTFIANKCFFENSINKLNIGGVYIIEDVDDYLIPAWRRIIQTKYINRYPNLIFTIIEIPHGSNPYNNKLVAIERIY